MAPDNPNHSGLLAVVHIYKHKERKNAQFKKQKKRKKRLS